MTRRVYKLELFGIQGETTRVVDDADDFELQGDCIVFRQTNSFGSVRNVAIVPVASVLSITSYEATVQ